METNMKPLYAIAVLILLVAGVGVGAYLLQPDPAIQGEVLSQDGLHWHAKLTVRVNGEVVDIPANMGLSGPVHNPMHTHDDEPGLIHMEFGGRVVKSDLALGKFFTVWGKDFKSFGPNVSMTVNGEANTEYENYQMQDGDVIEVSYQ